MSITPMGRSLLVRAWHISKKLDRWYRGV